MGELAVMTSISLVVGGTVGVLIGNAVNRKTAGFWFGLFLGPIGWIIVLLLPRKGSAIKQTQVVAVTKRPERNLDNDDYKIWLGKTYNIQKNELFEKFECEEQLFESLEEALIFADKKEGEKEEDEKENEEKKERVEQGENLMIFVFLCLLLVFLSPFLIVKIFS